MILIKSCVAALVTQSIEMGLKAKPDGKMLWKPVIQKYGKK
jgi:hypothetical protein